MKSLKTVFWDLDGTIADTELSGHRVAFNLAFKDYSLRWNWSKESYIRLLSVSGGKNRIAFYSKQQGNKLSEKLIQHIHTRKQYYYRMLVLDGNIQIRCGVIRLIKEIADKGTKQYIVTTSSKYAVEALIKKYFDNKTFEGYICSEDISKSKPNPESYMLAMNKSNSTPNNSIAIEDSLIGLKSAKEAGLKCVVTYSPWHIHNNNNSYDAELVVDHLGDNDNIPNVFAGELTEENVNYNSLLSLLNHKEL
ncbi:hypothetical protein EV06_1173 [Prochlorococcus sp. MIT 0602]|uniref:HAD-IA family hydrolase n=1 Tax=unclassified Prochlorococcus TaxID=2627481 RepID=UPI0005338A7B|nr:MULTISPECIES: HAD-IA family hydrolase [unclassified Prochlorococcus]KGG15302.1 hypothetical protein EV06_1173 [Prochlorococcus sp. MIT 0602]KGG17580.1 hypothetical protein EV07_1020 [Prochlorococcus sp. MIT 0603]